MEWKDIIHALSIHHCLQSLMASSEFRSLFIVKVYRRILFSPRTTTWNCGRVPTTTMRASDDDDKWRTYSDFRNICKNYSSGT